MPNRDFLRLWSANRLNSTWTNKETGEDERGNWRAFIYECWGFFYPKNPDYLFTSKKRPLSSADGAGDFDPDNKNDQYHFLSERCYQKATALARKVIAENKKNGTKYRIPVLPGGYKTRDGSAASSKPVSGGEIASFFDQEVHS